MKLLFLDIDGVLNSVQGVMMHRRRGAPRPGIRCEEDFCPNCVSNLQFIMDACPDLNIVVSSTWRMGGLEKMREVLKRAVGIEPNRILDITPILRNCQRGIEIQAWLDENTKAPEGSPLLPRFQVEDFIIIDDDSDMAHLRDTHFLQTDNDLGLTIKDARKVITRFGGNLDGW